MGTTTRAFQFRRIQREYETPYKVTNWSSYERSLRERLSLTLWIGPALVRYWRPRVAIGGHAARSGVRMSRFKRTQATYVKKTCRVRNRAAYEAGLRSRGSLTVWISVTDGKLANWDAPRRTKRKAGRPPTYSNHAIETMVILGLVFHLASRQTEGFVRSSFGLLQLAADVPDHTTISRRKARLARGDERWAVD